MFGATLSPIPTQERTRRSEPRRRRALPAPELPPRRELVRRELAADAARIRLTELVEVHGSPLLVLDTDRIATRLLALRRELPGVHLHFALGALPHPAAIRAVHAFGAGFDVASRGEITLLEREGIPLRHVVHVDPVKRVDDLTSAYLRGIRTFVVDATSEVAKFAGLPRDVAVLVRLAFPGRGAGSAAGPAAGSGVTVEAAPALVAHCRRVGLRVAGFTFHLGDRQRDPAVWEHAIRGTLALVRALERRHGTRFEMLDLGGGLPLADDAAADFDAVASGIRGALTGAPAHLRIVIAPGRFVAAPAMTLVARVVGGAERPDGRWLALDGAPHDLLPALRQGGTGPLVFAAEELASQPVHDDAAERATRRLLTRHRVPTTLAGPTNDRRDVLARSQPLPPLGIGDLVVSPAMGAYALQSVIGFDGSAIAPVVVVPQ
ncbi:type III PLP-dependent enzyme [Agromyces sp. NPDC058126]|uniref:type III PLP-dependent enzyme n=1 Tax=Agromyces sp. NPDC058126 TaxID=3346350 RepID=UPI0036DC79DA